MGLPRYLNDIYIEWFVEKNAHHADYILFGVELAKYKNIYNRGYVFHNFNVSNDSGDLFKVYSQKALKSMFGYSVQKPVYNFCINLARGVLEYNDLFEKVNVKYYTHAEKIDGVWTLIYSELKVNRYFAEYVEKITFDRVNKEIEFIKKKELFDKIKNIEQGRFFKGRLRQIILERDNYKCVLCGRSASDNIILEIDHIIQWSLGGKTIYDNGRTVCNECNKGLFHFNKYHELENTLKNNIN
jgi:hypothetical protein